MKRWQRELLARELWMLQVIDRYRILWAIDIAWLCGFTDETYCRKVLMRLIRMGLVQIVKDWYGHNCYYLTADGIREIGKSSREYEVTYTTGHALRVGHVASWLHAVHGADGLTIQTDIELKKLQRADEHRPDLVYDGVAYEIEWSHKSLDRLEKNMLSNEQYGRQVWIVPDDKKHIRENLRKVADQIACDIEIITWGQIESQLAQKNIHMNGRGFSG